MYNVISCVMAVCLDSIFFLSSVVVVVHFISISKGCRRCCTHKNPTTSTAAANNNVKKRVSLIARHTILSLRLSITFFHIQIVYAFVWVLKPHIFICQQSSIAVGSIVTFFPISIFVRACVSVWRVTMCVVLSSFNIVKNHQHSEKNENCLCFQDMNTRS